MGRLAVVAIGGNSLITDPKNPDIPHQWEAVRETCGHLADMVVAGWQVVIVHGNGPQAGYSLRRSELAAHEVHQMPLDLIVAQTQGAIGYMLQQGLSNELHVRRRPRTVVTLVTQVEVDKDDPAFAEPVKPIGGFMSEAEARLFEAEGWQVVEDAGRGWRRVVASPQPQYIVEQEAIGQLIKSGAIVIAVGGGGIPVRVNEYGKLEGVYAVIDKDRAASLLAQQLGADLFLISTAVPRVAIHYNTLQQQDLTQMSLGEARRYMADGHFSPGSMRPKVEAVVDFVTATDQLAIITNPKNIGRALAGQGGTRIIR
ncbi:MAG TPA: carbamate kinase [Anaerolineae bacterium]|nr:carbamate kinase [Anaerolineae bacterium]